MVNYGDIDCVFVMRKRNAELKKRILITGIPASGKTAIGDYFRDKLSYTHCDLERLCDLNRVWETGIMVDFKRLVRILGGYRENVIVTWGFASVCDIDFVKRLKSNGFKLFWFDGNRPAALRAYIRRGTRSEYGFYVQMAAIERNKVVEKIDPVQINPFKDDFNFKSKRKIAGEILSAIEGAGKRA